MLTWMSEERIEVARQTKMEFARQSVIDFTKYTKLDYRNNWHHAAYTSKLDDFMNKKIKNLMVFMPP